ncbi:MULTISPECIES: hypothetical protein [unclassified Microbispora]|uniref:hypothetical protein n=1 Tax=unclassified Microbispora TaxID=2614687 RepID=UPI0020162256|nr:MULTISPECIES: hypothetical protein [unclassified Microbispora]
MSYAHTEKNTPPGPNELAMRFFNDLCVDLAVLVPRIPGAPYGFIDRSMGGGERWEGELLDALGTCQVFIPLLMAPYMRSKWCAMEWHGFSRRRVVRLDDSASVHQTCILPVIWAPAPDGFPEIVGSVERFAGENLHIFAEEIALYEAHGIFGLRRLGRSNEYHTVVWLLAQRIQKILMHHRVEPLALDVRTLGTSFEEPR